MQALYTAMESGLPNPKEKWEDECKGGARGFAAIYKYSNNTKGLLLIALIKFAKKKFCKIKKNTWGESILRLNFDNKTKSFVSDPGPWAPKVCRYLALYHRSHPTT